MLNLFGERLNLSFGNKTLLESCIIRKCHTIMDYKSSKPAAEVAKGNKQLSACIRRSADSC